MSRTSVATDDFNRASLGANWTQLNPTNNLIAMAASVAFTGNASITNNEAAAIWAGSGSFTDDQYAEIAIGGLTWITIDFSVGVIVRASTDTDGARDFYFAFVAADPNTPPPSTTVLGKVVNGVRTVLASATVSWANGDLLSLEAEGTTLRVCKNGTPIGGAFTTTDSALTTGKPGILANSNNLTGDNWVGGNITASAPTFTTQPQGAAAAVGGAAGYTVTSADATSYQWQQSTDAGLTWSNVTTGSGGTTASYTTAAAVAGDNGKKYRCVATNAGGSSNSRDVWFHVSGLPSAGKGRAFHAVFGDVENRWGPRVTSPLHLLQTKSVMQRGRDFAAARATFFFTPPQIIELAGSATAQTTATGEIDVPQKVYAPRPIGTRRARPGRGPYSTGRYYRPDTRFYGAASGGGGAAALAANAQGQATASGTLTTAIPFNGVALIVANASGALSTGINLAGSAANIVAASGALTAQIRLNGAAVAQALAAAGLTTQIVLAAAAQIQASASGTLGVPGAALAGNAQGQAAASGALTTGIPLDGTAQAAAAASGNLSTQIALGGNAAAVAVASASLTAQINLNGAAVAQALAAAGLTTAINLAANAQAQVTAGGELQAPSALAGNAVAQAQATGSLSTAIRLAGAAQAQATASGTLGVPINLAGAAVVIVSGSGALTATIRFNAAALAQVLATGDLVTHINLNGAALAQAAASGSLAVEYVPTLLPRYRVRAPRRIHRAAIAHRNYVTREAA